MDAGPSGKRVAKPLPNASSPTHLRAPRRMLTPACPAPAGLDPSARPELSPARAEQKRRQDTEPARAEAPLRQTCDRSPAESPGGPLAPGNRVRHWDGIA